MGLWGIKSLLWIPCLLVAIALQLRAIYFKKIMVRKYGFRFPERLFGLVRTDELKTNRRMTESENLKKVITSFINSKKWVYRFLILAVLIVVVPYLFELWITSTTSPGKK